MSPKSDRRDELQWSHDRPAPASPVRVGLVLRPHGLHGQVAVHRFNAESELFEAGKVLWVSPAAGPGRWMQIRSRAGERLALVGVDNRSAAEALRGRALSVDRSQLPPAAEDERYLVDLLGFSVLDAAGRDLGLFEGLLNSGNREFFVIRGAREVLLPAEAPIVGEVRTESRSLTLAVEVEVEDEEAVAGRQQEPRLAPAEGNGPRGQKQ